MSGSVTSKWDKIYAGRLVSDASPCWTLSEYQHLLPVVGDALDLACGLGGNGQLLARRGLRTEAWDTSHVAVDRLKDWASEHQLPLLAEVRDVEAHPPLPDSFDVIVVANFLYRPHLPDLSAALRDGGVLVYQTHSAQRPEGMSGPSNPDFLLTTNELLKAFPSLTMLAYHEEGLVGDLDQGHRGMCCLVAIK